MGGGVQPRRHPPLVTAGYDHIVWLWDLFDVGEACSLAACSLSDPSTSSIVHAIWLGAGVPLCRLNPRSRISRTGFGANLVAESEGMAPPRRNCRIVSPAGHGAVCQEAKLVQENDRRCELRRPLWNDAPDWMGIKGHTTYKAAVSQQYWLHAQMSSV